MELLCAGEAHPGSGAGFSVGQFEVSGQGFPVTCELRLSVQ